MNWIDYDFVKKVKSRLRKAVENAILKTIGDSNTLFQAVGFVSSAVEFCKNAWDLLKKLWAFKTQFAYATTAFVSRECYRCLQSSEAEEQISQYPTAAPGDAPHHYLQ